MGKLATLLDNIETTLVAAASIDLSQSYDELEENIPETPILQVYPNSCLTVSTGSNTDRLTFGGTTGGVVQKTYEISVDLFVQQRKFISQEMEALVDLIEELEDILVAQPKCNCFGDTNVGSFQWRWDRVSFKYSGADFVGVKIILTVRMK